MGGAAESKPCPALSSKLACGELLLPWLEAVHLPLVNTFIEHKPRAKHSLGHRRQNAVQPETFADKETESVQPGFQRKWQISGRHVCLSAA